MKKKHFPLNSMVIENIENSLVSEIAIVDKGQTDLDDRTLKRPRTQTSVS